MCIRDSISTGYYNLDINFQNNDSKLSLTEEITYTAGKNHNTNSQIPENNKVIETNDSVSYTHLDVYKRQTKPRIHGKTVSSI